MILITVYVEFLVKAELRPVIIAEMKTASETAVNTAVSDFLVMNPEVGARLTEMIFGDGGGVAAITTDPSYINFVKADITDRAQENIEALTFSQGVSVPLGSFTGLTFLSNLGPDVRLEIGSRQTVRCSFNSTFDSAGINQTIHHITLTVDVETVIYSPFRIDSTVHTATSYEIAQTVIVGTVPTYGGVLTY